MACGGGDHRIAMLGGMLGGAAWGGRRGWGGGVRRQEQPELLEGLGFPGCWGGVDAPLIVCPVPVRSPPSHPPVEAVDGCDLMELRLDYLRSGHLEAIMESRGLPPAVVTIRDPPREGGVHPPLAEEEKAALLERALGLGFMVDAEMEFLSRHPPLGGPGGGVIASRHVLGRRASWRVLGGDYARASSLGYPPIYKAAAGGGRRAPPPLPPPPNGRRGAG